MNSATKKYTPREVNPVLNLRINSKQLFNSFLENLDEVYGECLVWRWDMRISKIGRRGRFYVIIRLI